MPIKFIDLFCGLGGFRIGAELAFSNRKMQGQCVFSSDIDPDVRISYQANFNEWPDGDITKVKSSQIPDHDLLLAGFPCQPFSIIGDSKGFEDARGTLFFDIARILDEKRPSVFVLENVKQLVSHDKGQTLHKILKTLDKLGYFHQYKVLNAMNFGLPQKRERVIIVGFDRQVPFSWPTNHIQMTPLENILEMNVSPDHYATERIRNQRLLQCKPTNEMTIWHENKSGHISAYPYSCALRAGASYNYLLVNGERRLTSREMLRLQGFPDTYKIACPHSKMRKQAGNSIAVPMVTAVVERVIDALNWEKETNYYFDHRSHQLLMPLEERRLYG